MNKWNIFALCLTLTCITWLNADHPPEKVEAGHSFHGGAFNEGPRQAAVLMKNMPKIDFPISSKDEQANAFFTQGVAQLHGFWYFESERSFRQVTVSDKHPMAYWGMAMANIDNQKRARDFLAKAYQFKARADKRELMYMNSFAAYLGLPTDDKGLDAYRKTIKDKKEYKPKRNDKDRRKDYVKKLEDLILKYPDDIEAKAFLVTQLWFNRYKGLPYNSHVAVESMLKEIFAVNPMHPAHHYRIHLWDDRKHEAALESAAKCAYTAKGIAHMWHMPGHIYSKAKRFQDAAFHQEASARVDHKHMMHYQVLPDQIHNFAHNNEWLTRNLIKLGRVDDALALAKNMIELPRHPNFNVLTKRGSARYGRTRLFEVLENFEMWDEAIELCHSVYLEPTDIEREKTKRLRLLGKAYLYTNKLADAENVRHELNAQKDKVIKKEKEEEKKKKEEEAKKKRDEAKKKKGNKKGEKNKAVKKDKNSKVAKQDKNKKSKKKPSPEIKYIEESLAELALVEYIQTGKKQKLYDNNIKKSGISNITKIFAHAKAKKWDEAKKIMNNELKRKKKEVVPLVLQTQLLTSAGNIAEAKKSFEELRKVSQYVDIDKPFFAKLDSFAKEHKYPKDWRQKMTVVKDTMPRPILNDLGPFRWSAPKAQDFTLPNNHDKKITLSEELKENHILLIFYLGAECLHCVEQMNAFAPKTKAYAEQGIKIMAVTLESVKELADSVDNYSDDKTFPFLITADPKLEIFKKYRAFDDFENVALHGTFLISKDSKILWQDISYEPFTKADWLLDESRRLLGETKPVQLSKGK